MGGLLLEMRSERDVGLSVLMKGLNWCKYKLWQASRQTDAELQPVCFQRLYSILNYLKSRGETSNLPNAISTTA